MNSDLPVRQSSNLHRRFKGHKPPPAAMETQRNIPTRLYAGEYHTIIPSQHGRSSSFSNFGRSLSRLLPANRKERGGTLKSYNDYGKPSGNSEAQMFDSSPVKIFKFEENEDDREELRKVRSWSPTKIARVVDSKDRDTFVESKPKLPDTFQTLWNSPKAAKQDGGARSTSTSPDRLKSKEREWQQHERKPGDDQIPMLNYGKQLLTSLPSPSREIDATLKRAKKLYEEKKARKDERRIFRESDDYLGVQGINPRTGYPDSSTVTSSTGDFLNESMQQKVDEDERRMENARIEYKAALDRREEAVRKLESERERRRKEKKDRGQKKKTELNARMRRDGRWKSEENRWNLVIEPDLSPIVQSLAGSPVRENPPTASKTPIQPSSNLPPIYEPSSFSQKDCFSQPLPTTPVRHYNSLVELASCIPLPPSHEKNMATASSTPRRKYMLPFVSHLSSVPQPLKSRPSSVESPQDCTQRSQLPIKSARSAAKPQEVYPADSQQDVLPVRCQKGGSCSQKLRTSSTETIIHKTYNTGPRTTELLDEQMSPIPLSRIQVLTSREITPKISALPIARSEQPFLDEARYQSNERDVQESLATATSFRSASTSQVLDNFQPSQNPKDNSPGNRVASQGKIPPGKSTDHSATGTPSVQQLKTSPSLEEIFQIEPRAPVLWSVAKGDRKSSTIITPTTTTIGCPPLPQAPSVINGVGKVRESQASQQCRASQNVRIPTLPFYPRNILSGSQRVEFPMNQATIDISSIHRPLATPFPTRQLVPRLCRGTLLTSGGEVLKSTPTSTFTFPQPLQPLQHQSTAQKTAQTALSHPSRHRPEKVVKGRCASLLSPNMRVDLIRKTSSQKKELYSRGNEDIGGPLKNRSNMEKNRQLLREMVKHAINLSGSSQNGEGETLIAWVTKTENYGTLDRDEDPTLEKMESQILPQKQMGKDNKVIVFHESPKRKISVIKVEAFGRTDEGVQLSFRKTSSDRYHTLPFLPGRENGSPDKDLPKHSILLKVYRKLKEIFATAWWLISPVFNTRSSLRERWIRGELTWQDVVLVTAATLFGGGTFLFVVVCMKALGLGLSIVRGTWGCGRWIVGF